MIGTPPSTLTQPASDTTVDARATLAQDAVTVAVGLWLIGGLFSDGWAHHNVPELEGFFTPWHGALYFGLLLAGAWFIWLGRAGGLRWYRDVPAGYGWGVVGIGIFAAGGLADMAWHQAFGVEAGIDALLSPSHLVLFAGGLLILTSAVRSRWGSGDIASPVAMGALTLATALVSFFLLYVSEFTANAPTIAFRAHPEGHPRHTTSELPATAGLGGFIITTALLVVPLIWTWQRGRAPRGLLTILVALISWLSAAVVDLDRAAVFGATGATLGAIVGEFALDWLENRGLPSRLRIPALAAAAIIPTWTVHMASLAVGVGLAWPIELWSGAVIVSGLAAMALGGLAVSALPPPVTDPAPRLETPVRVVPGGFDQESAGVAVAGFGDRPAVLRLPRGVLGRGEPDEGADRVAGEPVPVTDLDHEPEPSQGAHPTQATEPPHDGGELRIGGHHLDRDVESVSSGLHPRTAS